MASPVLAGTNPLQTVNYPLDPKATTPKAGSGPKPSYGTEIGAGIAIPVDLSFPPAPKTVWENKFVRFKFALDAKYEVVRDDSPKVEQDNDFKFDPWKKKGTKPRLVPNYTAGIKAHVTSSLDASISYKFKWETIEMVRLLLTDRQGFKLALLRNLDVVFGTNLGLTGKDGKPISECLKYIGIGLTFDPDLCIFSVLLPVTFPFWADDVETGQKRKFRIVTNMVLKFAPSRALWIAVARKLGIRKAFMGVEEALEKAVNSMTRLLPSEAAALEAGTEKAAAEVLAGAATGGGSASIYEMFVAWLGIYSIALPIALTITDFMIYTTRKARAAGAKDGDLNLYATTYVRAVYGLSLVPHATSRGMAVQEAAWMQAEQDVKERGRDALQDYLEDHFNGGHSIGDVNGVVHGSWEINPMAERMWLEMRKRFN